MPTKNKTKPSRTPSPSQARKATTGKNSTGKAKLGSGLLGKAEMAMKGRTKKVDDAVKKAGG